VIQEDCDRVACMEERCRKSLERLKVEEMKNESVMYGGYNDWVATEINPRITTAGPKQ
jgi:hypothetical protein